MDVTDTSRERADLIREIARTRRRIAEHVGTGKERLRWAKKAGLWLSRHPLPSLLASLLGGFSLVRRPFGSVGAERPWDDWLSALRDDWAEWLRELLRHVPAWTGKPESEPPTDTADSAAAGPDGAAAESLRLPEAAEPGQREATEP